MQEKQNLNPEHIFTAEGVVLSLMSGTSLPLRYREKKQSFPYLYLHTHSWYELFYCINGKIEIHSEESLYSLTSGDAVLVAPRFSHFLAPSGTGEWLAFSFSAKPTGEETETAGALFSFLRFEGVRAFHGGELCDRICPLLRGAIASRDWTTAGCLLLSLLLSAAKAENAPTETPALYEGDMSRIYRIEELCTGYLHENITLSDLSKALHLSERQISRIIRRQYGKTFRAYLASLRMEAATSMLGAGASIQSTAAAVGYASVAAFSTVFKRTMGLSPGEYRRTHEGNAVLVYTESVQAPH